MLPNDEDACRSPARLVPCAFQKRKRRPCTHRRLEAPKAVVVFTQACCYVWLAVFTLHAGYVEDLLANGSSYKPMGTTTFPSYLHPLGL